MQKHVNLVDLVKSFPTNIFLQNLASIQKRTSPIKFDHLAEKSANGSISNLSTKVLPLLMQPGVQPFPRHYAVFRNFPERSFLLGKTVEVVWSFHTAIFFSSLQVA